MLARGLGVTTTGGLLEQQTAGQQPSFIQGSYPGATWTAYDSDNNGYGVFLPYTTNQEIAGGPANQQMVNANQNVENQFSALLLQAFPAMAQGELVIPAGASYIPTSGSDPNEQSTGSSYQADVSGAQPAGSTPSMTSNDGVNTTNTNVNTNLSGSGLDLTTMLLIGAGVLVGGWILWKVL